MSIRNDMSDTSGIFLNSGKFRGRTVLLYSIKLRNRGSCLLMFYKINALKMSQNSLKKSKSQSLLNKAASFPPGTGGLDTGVFLRIWWNRLDHLLHRTARELLKNTCMRFMKLAIVELPNVGQSIQEWTKKNLWKPLKSLKGYGLHKHVFACDLQIRMQTLSSVCKIDRHD